MSNAGASGKHQKVSDRNPSQQSQQTKAKHSRATRHTHAHRVGPSNTALHGPSQATPLLVSPRDALRTHNRPCGGHVPGSPYDSVLEFAHPTQQLVAVFVRSRPPRKHTASGRAGFSEDHAAYLHRTAALGARPPWPPVSLSAAAARPEAQPSPPFLVWRVSVARQATTTD